MANLKNKGVSGRDLKANLVIIGGGGAGMAAAATAVEHGVTGIVLLEKAGSPGGNTAMAGGIFAADSPAQHRVAMNANKDEIYKKAMDYAHWKINPRILRAFIDKSGDTVKWLEDKGLYFECSPLYHGQYPQTWHIPKGQAAEIIKVLKEECTNSGVQILTRARAKKILTGPKGEVNGVVAETKEQELTIKTKGIIIASGGYGANKELVKKYLPYYGENLKYDGVPANTGDGLLMAMELGAATEGLGLFIIWDGPNSEDVLSIKFKSLPEVQRIGIAAIIGDANVIWVNKRGQRFSDETAGSKHMGAGAIARQPEQIGYTLFDYNFVRNKTTNGVLIGFGLTGKDQRSEMPGLENELKRLAAKGAARISKSLDDIAKWISIDPEILKKTVEEYNADCDRGCDTLFMKDRQFLVPLRTPPYYAVKAHAGYLDTLGGIKVNEKMQVLDKQDNPIPRLFAAGVAAGGWQAECYCGLYMSGAACGFAINSGRIAGENAAKLLSIK